MSMGETVAAMIEKAALMERVVSGLADATSDVQRENIAQLRKWSIQDHSDDYWFGILLEEVGEVADALLHSPCHGDRDHEVRWLLNQTVRLGEIAKGYIEGEEPNGISRVNREMHPPNLALELTQVAAVAVAALENHRRVA